MYNGLSLIVSNLKEDFISPLRVKRALYVFWKIVKFIGPSLNCDLLVKTKLFLNYTLLRSGGLKVLRNQLILINTVFQNKGV